MERVKSMGEDVLPREIVDRQMRAYNARDIDSYCALYASDAVLSMLHDGAELARGSDAIRAYYTRRFNNSPNLHYEIKQRTVLGAFVIDHELVTGIDDGVMEVIAIYEVRDSLIRSLRFIRS